MAIVVITIQDIPAEDISFVVESDPVFNKDGVENTYAQELALALLASVSDIAREEGTLKSAKLVRNDGSEEDLFDA